jgi:cell wall-associated NlpC family hydrolase
MDRSGKLRGMALHRLWLLFPLVLFSCAHVSRDEPYPRERAAGAEERSCKPLTDAERARVLRAASLENFPATRYLTGASGHRATDCSHFVHDVYREAGLPFRFLPTAELGNAREFDILPEKEARPGDIMLFRGHVGIVGDDGKIISALYRRHRRKSSIASVDRKFFKTFHGQRYVLRYRCSPVDAPSRVLASETSSAAPVSIRKTGKKPVKNKKKKKKKKS